ncbi:hypothetical protein [Obesumbacterium proteus]|uniref:hypothetical protein n=1 Tax=Obesumbacterium proteus TaxID=82983 RepID=UPI000A8588C2|nr:hypothetical protein [Obesumbacterium proteus]
MNVTLIKNATIINEGIRREADLLIKNGRIEKIARDIKAAPQMAIVNADGKWLIPGMIDDQVHFREPGMPTKGTIASESRAAVAGGSPVTWKCLMSFRKQPTV